MSNPEPFADNFEARTKQDGKAYPQVLTIFKIAMTNESRIGARVAPGEFAEFKILRPDNLTLHLRVDRGRYWVWSRQVFELTSPLPASLPKQSPILSEEENRLLASLFEPEVSRARYSVQKLFPDEQPGT